MTYKTHVVAGIGAGFVGIHLLTQTAANLPQEAVFVCMACIGALFPDIDKSNSYIGRRLKLISCITEATVKHRKLVHTPFFQLIFFAAIAIGLIAPTTANQVLRNFAYLMLYGFEVGVFSHLILDTLNPEGIQWLYPFGKKRYSLLKIETRSLSEHIYNLLQVIAVSICIIKFH